LCVVWGLHFSTADCALTKIGMNSDGAFMVAFYIFRLFHLILSCQFLTRKWNNTTTMRWHDNAW